MVYSSYSTLQSTSDVVQKELDLGVAMERTWGQINCTLLCLGQIPSLHLVLTSAQDQNWGDNLAGTLAIVLLTEQRIVF
jgi:hypothetical protein